MNLCNFCTGCVLSLLFLFLENGVIESGINLVMIKNGVKYGMMNCVKGHPLEPSFAAAAAGLHIGLLPPVHHAEQGITPRRRQSFTGALLIDPHAGLLPPSVAELFARFDFYFSGAHGRCQLTTVYLFQRCSQAYHATFTPTLPPLRSAATAQQLRARPRRRYSLHYI